MLDQNAQMRLDKWLWAARFFKTRALAQRQIELGRILVNNARVKNSKLIGVGDTLTLTLNALPFKLDILALSTQRRPAPEARALYQEDQNVVAKRIEILTLNKAMQETNIQTDERPTKKDRRELDRFKSNW